MATYANSTEEDLDQIRRLMNHHDHFKTMNDFYGEELNRLTMQKMSQGKYQPDLTQMKQYDDSYFTSLILNLSTSEGNPLFEPIKEAYARVAQLIHQHYPSTQPETYLEAAHITIKSILSFRQQSLKELQTYRSILRDPINKWLQRFAPDTVLFFKGFFVSISAKKGLSVGVRVFPSTSLIQTLRGVAGVALYNAMDRGEIPQEQLLLEAQSRRNTLLTHSTGMRVRDSTFLPTTSFIKDFEELITDYQDIAFGKMTKLTLADFYIRNGKSDKLLVGPDTGIELAL